MAVALVALGGFHDEDLVLLGTVRVILGLLLLLEYGLGPRGQASAFTPRQTAALALTGATLLVAASIIGWHTTRPRHVFEQHATSICRAFVPRIAAAPDPQTALAARRGMRLRLSVLTPLNDWEQRISFGNWLASLEAMELADARGNSEQARRLELVAHRGATALGLEQGCAPRSL